jgi:hypothetical protein
LYYLIHAIEFFFALFCPADTTWIFFPGLQLVAVAAKNFKFNDVFSLDNFSACALTLRRDCEGAKVKVWQSSLHFLIRVPCIFYYFFAMTNKCTLISQIITLLCVSTLSCHPQEACIQYLAKLHQYFKCSCW